MATNAKKKPKASKANANGVPRAEAGVLTLAEAAKLLRVSEAGLKADAAAGRVPCRLVAGEWRFTKEAIFEWLSQPEDTTGYAKTGAELVERIKRIREASRFPETAEEAEAFIANIYAARKANPVGGK
jgi:hypothetical protein